MDNRCKRFLHEPDWTPNNYDIYINPSEIPANIQKENTPNIGKRLKKLIPLSKRLHVHVSDSPETLSQRNNFHISTELKFNKKKVKFK